MRNTRKTGRVGATIRLEAFRSFLAAPTAPFALLRNTRKTGRVGATIRLEAFLSFLAAPTAPFALLMRSLGLLLLIAAFLHAGVVIDWIAVVVNRRPIKASDIERDIRLTDFLNKANLNFSPAEEKAAEERLIDQQLIRSEIASGGYRRATDADANTLLGQIRHDRYGDSEIRLNRGLEQYGLTENELRAQLLWQLTVLRFINERFRAGVLVSDEDIEKYYEQHRAQFRTPLATASPSIRDSLEGEQVNQQFEMWLDETRKEATIEYKVDFGKETVR